MNWNWKLRCVIQNMCIVYKLLKSKQNEYCCSLHDLFSPVIQKEVDADLDRLVGQEGTIHTKMLALQRMGYSL